MARKDPRIEAVEDELIDCTRMLWRLPDRERGYLLSGERAWWPTILRDQGDYPDEVEARPQLRRSDVHRVEAMFLRPGCHAEQIDRRDRRLVATVIGRKAGRLPGGFRWEDIWEALRGQLATGASESDGRPKLRKVTSDAMRKRYELALDRLAPVILGADSTPADVRA
jgi:hypothetical protein